MQWKRDETPAITPLDGSDQFQLGGIAVVRANGGYFLWYSLVADFFSRRPTSPLYLATSEDGIRWQQHGQVLTATEQLPRFIAPSVVFDGERFHLWFVDSLVVFENAERKEPTGGPFLRHLRSPDGRAWQEEGQFPLGSIDRGRLHV